MNRRQAVLDTPRRRATYRDVLEAPPHMVAEIVSGTLHTHPRPAPRHARASSALGAKIGDPFDYGGGPGGWWILDEPELHLADDILVPDIAGWRRERMPDFPDTAFFTLAPDWVCEGRSPGTSTAMASARSMRARACAISGSSIRPRATWRHSNCATAHGSSSPPSVTTTQFPSRPSRRSHSPSTPSGPEAAQADSFFR